ncbi:MAG: hypothetical protein CBC47_03620 [Alphaproteobacteria bacterium TMED87]|nr:pyrroline-5-carboxylate reductase [Rhodospirillaceae bacterium]MAI06461.1 pyrroline-5-carboxylate reductase [Rhodospirillaceae bacterium]OUV09522.1 MAG: hypothetical protein CBC47_04975 [Alphaproteobacteria bacterium TMED87]OUV10250.1 MAG: hypothetical protein CBC47_03620 [Alphaproteobacteria bacterium TMED87]
MTKKNQFFDDVAKVAGGALSAIGGLKEETENLVKQRVEKFINRQNLVTREEFDVIKEMLSNIQREQILIKKKIKELESDNKNSNESVPKQKKPRSRQKKT